MSNQMFEFTTLAHKEITQASDMAWALAAGIWKLRYDTILYRHSHFFSQDRDVQKNVVPESSLSRINLKKIVYDFTWDYEKQYIAQLFLINAIAIFDTWIDNFIDKALLKPSIPDKEHLKKDTKSGDFRSLDIKLQNEKNSKLCGCFNYNKESQHIKKLILIYRYFKACRNCCAHGNKYFTRRAESCYNKIKLFTANDCGLNEFPEIFDTIKNKPFKLSLRGVIGFYDVLLKIINHYDSLAANKIAMENELLRKIEKANLQKINTFFIDKKSIKSLLRNYMIKANMPEPNQNKIHDIYIFLKNKNKKNNLFI